MLHNRAHSLVHRGNQLRDLGLENGIFVAVPLHVINDPGAQDRLAETGGSMNPKDSGYQLC
jgi:hypothetical protein